jgi:2-hydroxychromene-2-carboxylate isomerase
MARIEFWFSIGSTYTYLTVMRLDAVAQQAGVAFDWRPFSVRAIMREMDNIPFANKPVKAAYMWRDIERRAASRGLAPRLPAPYPLREFDLANRVALVGCAEGWGPAYVTEAYRRWFESGEEPGLEPGLGAAIRAAGEDPARVIALAEDAATGAAYERATAAARERGIFGAPSFVVGDELFWGDDRLEDAVDRARTRETPGESPTPPR